MSDGRTDRPIHRKASPERTSGNTTIHELRYRAAVRVAIIGTRWGRVHIGAFRRLGHEVAVLDLEAPLLAAAR